MPANSKAADSHLVADKSPGHLDGTIKEGLWFGGPNEGVDGAAGGAAGHSGARKRSLFEGMELEDDCVVLKVGHLRKIRRRDEEEEE